MTKHRGSKLAMGGLLLAGLGYMAGILTAPKSGKETRKDIQRTMARAKTQAEKQLKQLHAELGVLSEEGKVNARKLSATAKKELDRALKGAQKARDRAKIALSALHEGESDDEELQRAITEADKALANLKKQIRKEVRGKKA